MQALQFHAQQHVPIMPGAGHGISLGSQALWHCRSAEDLLERLWHCRSVEDLLERRRDADYKGVEIEADALARRLLVARAALLGRQGRCA